MIANKKKERRTYKCLRFGIKSPQNPICFEFVLLSALLKTAITVESKSNLNFLSFFSSGISAEKNLKAFSDDKDIY